MAIIIYQLDKPAGLPAMVTAIMVLGYIVLQVGSISVMAVDRSPYTIKIRVCVHTYSPLAWGKNGDTCLIWMVKY